MMTDVALDYGRMLDVLGIEAQLLIAATHDVHADLPVAGVSGRTVGQTVQHLGDLCEDTLSWLGESDVAGRRWELPPNPGLREVTNRFAVRMADVLAELGVAAEWVPWDDPDTDFTAADLVVLRATWDYAARREEFLKWCDSVPGLVNPAPVARWNTDKSYLVDLAAQGVPVVPTELVAPDAEPT